MIKGIGIDIVDLKRIDNKIAKKILSLAEYNQYEVLNEERKKEYLAGRFAVKEALFKASGENIDYKQISIINNKYGKPILNYENSFLSISHDGDYVCAVVVLEEGNNK